MPDIEFAGRSRRDADNPAANPARLLNLYRRPLGGEADYVLIEVLGQELVADIDDVLLRAMHGHRGEIFAACGGGLYSVVPDGTVASLSSIVDSENTTIRSNNADITITAGGEFYVWDGSLTTPTGGAFDDVGGHDFIGQHTVLTERGGRRFMWSAPADPTDLDGLDFATAEDRDDDIIRPMAFGGNVWFFKEASIEVWYMTDSEDTTERFVRLPGGVIDTGLKSFGLITRVDGGAAFVGDDGVVYRTTGGGREPLSVPSVHTAIERGSPSRLFRYEDEGHEMVCLQFTDRPAWCCDLSSKEWHERAEGVTFEPWSVVDTVKIGGRWYAGNNTGRITRLVRTAQDMGGPLRRSAIGILSTDVERFTLSRMDAHAPSGVTDLGRPATIWARFSKDGGMTWGREKPRSLGAVGRYKRRARWKSQGQFEKTCTVELTMTDPMSAPIEDRLTVKIA